MTELAFGFGACMLGVVCIGAGFVRNQIVLIIMRALCGIGESRLPLATKWHRLTVSALFQPPL